MGKKPAVAPYSGAMLASVAREGTGSASAPGPKYSITVETTLSRRSRSVTVSTRSVAVAPGGSVPASRTPTNSGTGKI